MQNEPEIRVRSASSFREEARSALRGRWKFVLLITLLAMLMLGSIIGARCAYSAPDGVALYGQLEVSIGPLASLSLWKDGTMYEDLGFAVPYLIPFSPAFAAAALLTVLLFLILTPIANLGLQRMELIVLDGKTPDFSVFHVSAGQYWRFVRTELLAAWCTIWPLLLAALIGIAVSTLFAGARIVFVLFAVIGMVIAVIRSLSYAATVYLIVTRPALTAREAVRESAALMQGRKGSLFALSLSFWGWAALAVLFDMMLEYALGATPLASSAPMLSALASVPLSAYIYVTQTAFLRDADAQRVPPQEASPEQAPPLPEAASSDPTPDDPWADSAH